MARSAMGVASKSTTIGAEGFGSARGVVDQVVGSTYSADKTAFEAALAVCVADGASPTQGHVNSANSAYTTLAADMPASGISSAGSDVVLSVDLARVTSVSSLRVAVETLIRGFIASGMNP